MPGVVLWTSHMEDHQEDEEAGGKTATPDEEKPKPLRRCLFGQPTAEERTRDIAERTETLSEINRQTHERLNQLEVVGIISPVSAELPSRIQVGQLPGNVQNCDQNGGEDQIQDVPGDHPPGAN